MFEKRSQKEHIYSIKPSWVPHTGTGYHGNGASATSRSHLGALSETASWMLDSIFSKKFWLNHPRFSWAQRRLYPNSCQVRGVQYSVWTPRIQSRGWKRKFQLPDFEMSTKLGVVNLCQHSKMNLWGSRWVFWKFGNTQFWKKRMLDSIFTMTKKKWVNCLCLPYELVGCERL